MRSTSCSLKAFGERACERTGRREALAETKHALDSICYGAESRGDRLKRNRQIAGRIERGEERKRYHPVGGSMREHRVDGARQQRLEAFRGGQVLVDPKFIEARAANGTACGERRTEADRWPGIVGEDIDRLDIEVVSDGLRGSVGFGRRRLGVDGVRAVGVAFGGFQQRILLKLARHEAFELQPRHLQEPDRLHELRRDDEGLGLPKLEFGRKNHDAAPPDGLRASPASSRTRHIALQLTAPCAGVKA